MENLTETDHETAPTPLPEFIADWRYSPDELLRQRELQRMLDEAQGRLHEKHRMVFLLRVKERFQSRSR